MPMSCETENSKLEENVLIIGRDTDFSVILSQLALYKSNIFFHKIISSRKQNHYFTTNNSKFQELQKIIAFLYVLVFTGCNTAFTFFLYREK